MVRRFAMPLRLRPAPRNDAAEASEAAVGYLGRSDRSCVAAPLCMAARWVQVALLGQGREGHLVRMTPAAASRPLSDRMSKHLGDWVQMPAPHPRVAARSAAALT